MSRTSYNPDEDRMLILRAAWSSDPMQLELGAYNATTSDVNNAVVTVRLTLFSIPYS